MTCEKIILEATSAGRFRINRCGDVIRKELGYPRPRLNVHTDVDFFFARKRTYKWWVFHIELLVDRRLFSALLSSSNPID
jgi:hypothetical protein